MPPSFTFMLLLLTTFPSASALHETVEFALRAQFHDLHARWEVDIKSVPYLHYTTHIHH